jgi:hypothetical protein
LTRAKSRKFPGVLSDSSAVEISHGRARPQDHRM